MRKGYYYPIATILTVTFLLANVLSQLMVQCVIRGVRPPTAKGCLKALRWVDAEIGIWLSATAIVTLASAAGLLLLYTKSTCARTTDGSAQTDSSQANPLYVMVAARGHPRTRASIASQAMEGSSHLD